MKRIALLMASVVFLSSGCATMYVNSTTQKEMAVHAVRAGDTVAVAVDITALGAVRQRPWAHLGAAIVDVATAYFLLTDGGRDALVELLGGTTHEENDGTVVIEGDGNVLTYSKQSNGTTSSSGSQTAPHGQSNFDADFIE